MIKILLFEFITGGGFAQQELPNSLVKEGALMLNTLINELAHLSTVHLTVLLDPRCKDKILIKNSQIIWISKNQSVNELLPALIETVDWVWPIAPETAAVLEKISALVETKNKGLLNSSAAAVAICSDKLATARLLKQQAITVVETKALADFSVVNIALQQWVIKPKDGVGCLNNYLVSNPTQFEQLKDQLIDHSNYIIQPYLQGDSRSLSCLFKAGKAWLICCNQQQMVIDQEQFKLQACIVNIATESHPEYQYLIDQIAQSIPELWGYVGVDIIHSEHLIWVLEINPRLTTSYAGIHQALGINLATTVLQMINHDPVIHPTRNHQITVSIE